MLRSFFLGAAALLMAIAASASNLALQSEPAAGEATPEVITSEDGTEIMFGAFDPAAFDQSPLIDNPWLPLLPGTHLVYEGNTIEEGESIPHRLEFTVTDLTKEIAGVRTVVAWIVDYKDGEIIEKEIAFYAQDSAGTVWYLGEHPEEYENGEFIAAPTWITGYEDARAGIKMWAEPQVGTPSYFQGWGPAVEWSDFGRVDQFAQEGCVVLDCFQDVLVITETSLGEPGAFQLKYYARDVGEIRTSWTGADATKEELELVEHTQLDEDALAEVRAAALEMEQHAYEISPEVYAKTAPAEHTPPAP